MKKRMKIAQIVTMHGALTALSDTPLPARLAADVASVLGQVGEVLNKASQAHTMALGCLAPLHMHDGRQIQHRIGFPTPHSIYL